MSKKSITKNYIYNVIYQILTIILPIITTPYVSRVLGAENIGIYSYTVSITTYFITIGSLGLALYGQREVAYVQNDKKRYSKVFWEIVLLKIITLLFALIIFYLSFVIRNNDYQIYYKILVLEIIGNLLEISWFLRGLEEFKKTVVRNILIKVISVTCIFIFVKTSEDLVKYFVIYVLSILIGNVSLWLYLPKYLVKIDKISLVRHIKPALALFIPQIAIQVYTMLDKVMIGTIIDNKAEVGFYEQSQKVIKMLLTIITSLGVVMLPRIANTFAKGDKEKIKKYMYKSFNFVCFMAFPMILGIIAVSDTFVPIFFGIGYEKVAILMKIISLIILFIGLSNVIGTQYLLPTKRQTEYTISVIIGAVINFCINILLIPNYGAIGASIGTVVAEGTVTIIQAIFVRKDFNFMKVIKKSKNYFIASLIMYVICILINYIKVNSLLLIILQMSIGGISYIAILLILKDSFLKEIKDKIITKFKFQKDIC